MDHPMQELKLNVSYFYQDDETRHLITAEEATQLNTFAEDSEFYMRGEKIYECYLGFRLCRISRTSLLALSLFLTLAVAVIMVTIVLLCTFLSLSNSGRQDTSHDDVIGVVNWLHYPVGDLAFRRGNHTVHY